MIDKLACARDAEALRARFNKSNLDPLDPFAIAKRIPRLTIALHPLGESISGLCVKRERFSLIAVNSTQTLGRQNFTLSHELYHLFFDAEMQSVICSEGTRKDEREQTADCFAGFFLLPDLALNSWLASHCPQSIEKAGNGHPSLRHLADDEVLAALLGIENVFGISRMALLVRLVESDMLQRERIDAFRQNVKRGARDAGYSLELYGPRKGYEQKQVSGDYINLVALMFGEKRLSQSLAQQMLADGFREDIQAIEFGADDVAD